MTQLQSHLRLRSAILNSALVEQKKLGFRVGTASRVSDMVLGYGFTVKVSVGVSGRSGVTWMISYGLHADSGR